MEAPSEYLPERLQKRDRELQLERQRKRQDREHEDSNRKAVNFFLDQFGKKYEEIDNNVNRLSSSMVDRDLIPTALGAIGKDIQSLQKYFSASTMILCLHDVRKAQDRIQLLQQRLQELEGKLLPKKKFGFKTRKACVKDVLHPHIEDQVDSGDAFLKMLPETDCGIKNKVNETVVMHCSSISGKDVVLSNLSDCVVKLMGSPSTVHINSIRNCTVLAGPVATSIFIEDCADSKFVVPCQQLRIHNTHKCDFYLHITSRVIIEDSSSIRVAPYNWSYEGIDQDFSAVGWDLNKNHWDCVDDFNWLANDVPSPNWCIIEEDARIIEWN